MRDMTPKQRREVRRFFAAVWQSYLRDPVYRPQIERQARRWEADRDNTRLHGARLTGRMDLTVIDGGTSGRP